MSSPALRIVMFSTIASLIALTQAMSWLSKAAAQASPQSFSIQADSLARDLTGPTAAQQFFQEGNDRLKLEIQQLQQVPTQPTEPLLKVNDRHSAVQQHLEAAGISLSTKNPVIFPISGESQGVFERIDNF